jgi:WXG100 family type VII secretion target
MPAAERSFGVDLDELARVVAEMAGCQARLVEVADETGRLADTLHGTWEGQAALAHLAAQRGWETAFRDLREALTAMRSAAAAAHGNYESAATTNVGMWERLR